MKENEIKAIVFDAGGVLLDLNLDRCKTAFKEKIGYNRIDELLDACHQKGIYGDMEEGKISADEFRALVLAESRPGSTPEMVDYCMAALLGSIDPDKADYINRLSQRYDLYLLSNNNEISWAFFLDIFERAGIPVQETFKEYFLSCRMGMLKPNPAIFRAVLDSIGLEPGEVLYIDDSPSNAAAASDVGMHGLHYRVGSDLEELVESALHIPISSE